MLPESAAVSTAAATLIDRYRTCEFATVTAGGDPIAWPVSGILEPSGNFLVTTSIAFPQKAHNIRRDPRVAGLFSDPTGSGLDSPDQVLIQGSAVVADHVDASFLRSPELWQRLHTIQPSSRAYSASALTRWLMDMYYLRLAIDVTPVRVRQLPAVVTSGPLGGEADGMLVATGEEWRRMSSAVLTAFDTSGALVLTRIVPRLDGAIVRLDLPDHLGIAPGRASILAHSHDEKLSNMRNSNLVGTLEPNDHGWVLTPTRWIAGQRPVGPRSFLPMIRGMRSTAARYLEKHGITRPEVDWARLREILATTRDESLVDG